MLDARTEFTVWHGPDGPRTTDYLITRDAALVRRYCERAFPDAYSIEVEVKS